MRRKSLPRFNDRSYAHFVTTRTYGKRAYFRDSACCRIVAQELDFYAGKCDFRTLGYVLMPDHMHLLVWWDIEHRPDMSISRIMNSIKTMTAKRIKRYLLQGGDTKYSGRVPDARHPTDAGFRLWQRGFYDFNIYSEGKLREKLDYMHNNPVRAGLVLSAEDYEWSSCRLYFSDVVEDHPGGRQTSGVPGVGHPYPEMGR